MHALRRSLFAIIPPVDPIKTTHFKVYGYIFWELARGPMICRDTVGWNASLWQSARRRCLVAWHAQARRSFGNTREETLAFSPAF
jgi:hypothetical protein